ncbi:MAG: hypothetical protein AB7D36_10275, partial [Oscillospiraceae bacterium]
MSLDNISKRAQEKAKKNDADRAKVLSTYKQSSKDSLYNRALEKAKENDARREALKTAHTSTFAMPINNMPNDPIETLAAMAPQRIDLGALETLTGQPIPVDTSTGIYNNPARESDLASRRASMNTEASPTFGERIGNVIKGAAKNYLGDLWSGAGTAVEATGGTYMTDIYQQQVDSERQRLEALKANKEKYYDTMTESQRVDIDDEIALVESQLAMNAKAVNANISAGPAAREAAKDISESGATDIQNAKEGLGSVGQNLVDLGVGAAQLAGDIATGYVTGGGIMPSMTARAFGGATEQAKEAGATLDQQLAYGAGSAALAYATERISNIAYAGLKVAAPGITDNVVKSAISKLSNKLSNTVEGRAVLNGVLSLAANSFGEGSEELLQDAIDPYLQKLTYNKDAETIFSSPEVLSNALYDFLIGSELGVIMQGGNIALNSLGGNAESNIQNAVPVQNNNSNNTQGIDNKQPMQSELQGNSSSHSADNTLASLPDSNISSQAINDTIENESVQTKDNTATQPDSAEIERRTQQINDASTVLGKSGSTFIAQFYDPTTQDSAQYFDDAVRYYNAGVNSEKADLVEPKYDILTKYQKEAAYISGQADAANGSALKTNNSDNTIKTTETEATEYGQEESGQSGDEGSGRDGERSYDLDPSEQSGSVEAWTGEAQSGGSRSAQAETAAQIRNSVQTQEQVSTAGQGISSGTTDKTLRVVGSDYWTPEMRMLYRAQEKAGRHLIYFTGSLEMRDAGGKFTARGAVSADGKRMWVRADHDTLTVEQIAKHEEFHAKAKEDGGLFEKVREDIISSHSEAEIDAMAEFYAAEYFTDKEGNATVDKDYILEEVFADAYAGIDVFENAYTDVEGATKFSDTVRDTTDSRENVAATDRTTGPPTERFSPVGRTKTGKAVAVIEDDILDGVSSDKWISTVKNAIRSRYPAGVQIANSAININSQSLSEIFYSEYSKRLKKAYPLVFKDKLRAAANSGDVLKAAQNWINEGLKHPRKGNITSFARGDVLLRVGGDDYTAEVIVANKIGGSMILYDIVAIKPAANFGKIKYSAGLNRETGTEPGNDYTLSTNAVSTDSIRDSAENSNTKEEIFSRDAESLGELRKQNDTLRERVDYWKSQTKRTERKSLRNDDVNKLGKSIIKDYSSEIKANAISDKLKSLGEFIVNNGDGKNELTYSEIKTQALDIAREVVQNASELTNSEELRVYRDIRSYLRNTKLAFNDKGEIADFNDFRKRNFGRFIISQNGLPVDTAYQELTKTYGEAYFPSDIINPADQLMHIADL